ncbi:MAG: ABC transporter ATPase [Flavicella sp.]
MYVDYQTLPASSRIWIYQSDRVFSEEEVKFISMKAVEFIDAWTRHGDHLKGSFTIKYNQFLVLSVDESFANASGCSIDASVRFIKQLEEILSVDMMNKLNTCYRDGELIKTLSLSAFQKEVNENRITEKTIVFNNMVQTKEAFESQWEVMAKDSWHSRFV